MRNRNCSVSIATRIRAVLAGYRGSVPGRRLFFTASKPALEAHPTSYTAGARVCYAGLKFPGREANHSAVFSAEIKKRGSGSVPPLSSTS